jgi:hypothetical protein
MFRQPAAPASFLGIAGRKEVTQRSPKSEIEVSEGWLLGEDIGKKLFCPSSPCWMLQASVLLGVRMHHSLLCPLSCGQLPICLCIPEYHRLL